MRIVRLELKMDRRKYFAFVAVFFVFAFYRLMSLQIISGVSIVSAPDYQCHSLERGDNICCCCEFLNSNTCMLILVNRAEEKLSVHREIAKFLTVYRVCYTPIETFINGSFRSWVFSAYCLRRFNRVCKSSFILSRIRRLTEAVFQPGTR